MRIIRTTWALSLLSLLSLCGGCVTVAEFRKLERQVLEMRRGGGTAGPVEDRARLAELAARIDALEGELRRVEGRIEVTEHRATQAVSEARAARAGGAPTGTGEGEAPDPAALEGSETGGASAEEVAAYRAAYTAWRDGDAPACVDRFRSFLQTYPSSAYADDSAYWLADCYFKQGDYKTAILRFDDVVSRYPAGNKAADALYRQGEALLRLGPGYGKAAGKAFERVLKEYPDSGRAAEAQRQLELLRSG